jgi:hypothetical protein
VKYENEEHGHYFQLCKRRQSRKEERGKEIREKIKQRRENKS